MSAPQIPTTACEGCGQPLLLAVPGRTQCARCEDPWAHAGWVGNTYRLDAHSPDAVCSAHQGMTADRYRTRGDLT